MRLGWKEIAVTYVIGEGELIAELADENLIRKSLSPSEEALAIDRRAALILAIAERDAEKAREAGEVNAQKNAVTSPKRPRSERGKRGKAKAVEAVIPSQRQRQKSLRLRASVHRR